MIFVRKFWLLFKELIMKSKVCFCMAILAVCTLLSAEQNVVKTRQWTRQKAQNWYDSKPWLVGANFLPSTAINQLEMWQAETFDPETIDRELGWAEEIGMNTMRVYLHDLLWKQDPEGFLKRMEQFLKIADKHNIKPMFVFFDAVWDPQPKLGEQPDPQPHVHNSGWVQSPHIDILKDEEKLDKLEPYVKGVLEHFKNDSRVLLWDLYNEPGNSGSAYGHLEPENKNELSMQLLKRVFRWARQVNPSQPLTAGVWTGEEWSKDGDLTPLNRYMLEKSDIITFHTYNDLNRSKERVESLKPWGRPLICTEYMARTADCTFAEHLPYFKKHRVGAINWGLVAGKSQTNYPWESWDKNFTEEPDVWFHDIFRPNGVPFDPNETELIKSLTGKNKQAKYKNPVLNENLADPAVLRYDNKYYMYATGGIKNNKGYRVWTSTNLVDWKRGNVVYRSEKPQAWAPDIWRDPASGDFYLYYTVSETVGVAVASSPKGPFKKVKKLVDEAIDAHMFRDDDGQLYLYYVKFPGFRITVQPMKNPTQPEGEPKVILKPESDWETKAGQVTEGPWIIKRNGRYYLLYSGSGANRPDYAVGYAVADNPLGPFKRAEHNPIVHRCDNVFGPGHGCAVQDKNGNWWHVYHQKRNDRVGWERFICVDSMWFDENGKLRSRATRGKPQPKPASLTK